MFFTHLPDMPANMSDEQIIQANEWLTCNVASEMWTTAQVAAEFKLSGARLTQLNKAYNIPGRILFGSTNVYIMKFAGPWFRDYVARQTARASTREAKKAKKGNGRPKKSKGAYTYTLFGQEYTETRAPGIVHAEWCAKLASAYPQYYADVQHAKVLPDVMVNKDAYPEYYSTVLPWRTEINEVFNKLKASTV